VRENEGEERRKEEGGEGLGLVKRGGAGEMWKQREGECKKLRRQRIKAGKVDEGRK